jgi:glucose dehydrogenase
MKISDLIFIGISGTVLALDRVTGKQMWATGLKRTGFVNVILQDEAVLACCYGEVFCLDALTGNAKWHNPLKGFGRGLATIATESCPGSGNRLVLAERHRRDEEEAAAAAGAGAS